MTELVLTVAAGTLTIAAPCILPMLPILLGASIGHASRTRPLFIVLGFVATFSATALVLGRLADAAGVAPDVLRGAAIVLLASFGFLMIWPAPFERAMARLGGVFRRVDALAGAAGAGNVGGLVLGATIGLLWTPCAGPVLGSILTLVATAEDPTRAGTLLVGYAVGAALPMLAIAYGGQRVATMVRQLSPCTARLQRGFGVLVVASAVAMHFGWDTALTARLASAGSGAARTSVLDDYGPAPEVVGIETWLNSEPLTMRGLRGKVVLVDFWTYACVNCIATLPYVVVWHERYQDQGLVVIGVHTPEFPFERSTANVREALDRHGIKYPVAQDNAYATWKAYDNHYWPAQYLVDRRGRIVLRHFGEGHYDEMEAAIRTLLGIDGSPSRPGRTRS